MVSPYSNNEGIQCEASLTPRKLVTNVITVESRNILRRCYWYLETLCKKLCVDHCSKKMGLKVKPLLTFRSSPQKVSIRIFCYRKAFQHNIAPPVALLSSSCWKGFSPKIFSCLGHHPCSSTLHRESGWASEVLMLVRGAQDRMHNAV